MDEQNRKALYKLRQTWNEVFSNRILFEIDVSVKKIDPAWPITASLQQKTQQPQSNDPYIISTKPSPPTSSKSILINQTNIINPANSQSVQQVVQHSPNATKITNGTNSMPTTTSNKSQEVMRILQTFFILNFFIFSSSILASFLYKRKYKYAIIFFVVTSLFL